MIFQILYGFLSSFGFGILFNVPKKHLFRAGLSGALGWASYLIVMHIFTSPGAATFVASIFIGVIGELFARNTKNPATIFIIPAIVPLVPGAASYRTIKAFIDGKNKEALELAIITIGLAVAISAGLFFVSSYFNIKKKKS